MRRQREADKRVWGQMLNEIQDMLQESRSENLILRDRVGELEEVGFGGSRITVNECFPFSPVRELALMAT